VLKFLRKDAWIVPGAVDAREVLLQSAHHET
jgi:hypothetical protein